jgi:hypothetical protein
MSAAESAAATTTTTPSDYSPALLVRDGVVAGVVAAVATTVTVLVAKALDVPMMAAPQTASAGEPLPVEAFALSTLMGTAIGVLLALALARWAPKPRVTFVVVTVALTLLSAAGPLTTGYATAATRVVLLLTHVVAAVIVIPVIARRLPTGD